MRAATKRVLKAALGQRGTRLVRQARRRLAGALAPKGETVKPDYGLNTVINQPDLINAKIIFEGQNNILYCEKGITLKNSTIAFRKNNSVVYLSAGPKGRYSSLRITVSHDSAVFIGTDTNFHKSDSFKTHILAQEQKHVIIGNDCIFSLSCWVRTSDAHAVYDAATKKRLNPGKSVLIGDHVWVGQKATILKGAGIGSGSIIGAGAIVPGKLLDSNAAYGGNPARAIKSGLFFDRQDVNHARTKREVHPSGNADDWIYSYDASSALTLETIDRALSAAKTSEAKLAYIKKHLAGTAAKNRFYIGPEHLKSKEG